MTTVSTKHAPQPTGDPALSIHGAKGTILDDMELIRKLCLPEKADNKHRNASNISFGRGAAGPIQTTKQADFGLPSMADVEPKTTRDARSRYMNTKHFDLGFDAPPMVTQNRATMMPPGRADLVGTSRNHMIGGPNDKNRSNIFSSDKDRDDWLNNLRSTNQDNFRPPPGDVRDPKNKEIIRQLRAHHFGFGNDPMDYLSHHNATFPQPTGPPEPPRPVKLGPTSVQLGAADYDWAKDLQTTHKSAYKTPVQRPEDALDVFLRDQPPLSFGEDKREMMTTYKGSYKNVGYLDCNNLTDDQLRLLGVTREEIIPRKIPLPFMTQAFKNSLDQPVQ